VVSSVYRDGSDVPHHLALGTFVVFEGETDYARRCFKEYAMLPDKTGKYACLYRPIHMIGLELGISVASAALRNEPTGAPTGFRSDVVATAKKPLKAGETRRLRRRALRERDLAVDGVVDAGLIDGEHHLGGERFGALEAAVGDRCAHGFLDFLLGGHADHLEEFAQRHVEGFVVHSQSPAIRRNG
jgi:hypothetical protein